MSSNKCFFTYLSHVERYSDPKIERIKIGTADGNKVVVGIDSRVNDTGILFYPDCQLDPAFMAEHGLNSSNFKNGRVRVARFKGEWSEALFIPKTPTEVATMFGKRYDLGESLPEKEGVYKVYIPPIKNSNKTGTQNQAGGKFKRGTLPEFPQHFDTQQLRSYLKDIERKFMEGWKASISLKVHGTCLQANSRILMADNTIKQIKDISIGDMVQSKDGPTKVIDTFNYPNINNWKEIKVSHIGGTSKLVCTNDHLIYTEKGFVQCDSLNEGDEIYLFKNQISPTEVQKDFHEGKLWGDGYFNNHLSLEWSHSKKYEEYFNYCYSAFGNLSGDITEKESGYGSETLFTCNKVSRFLNSSPTYLNPRVLAIWYMDDGNLMHSDFQSDRAMISVCRYSEDEIDNKIIPLFASLNLYPVKTNNSDGHNRLRFNLEEANKLFDLISPYIPECMRYKLPKDYVYNFSDNFDYQIGETKGYLYLSRIESINDISLSSKENKKRYDITTESHSFIANNIVVHNSARVGHIRVPKDFPWYIKLKLWTRRLFRMSNHELLVELDEKYYNTLGDYERVIGTRRTILSEQKKKDDDGFHSVSFRERSSYFKDKLEKDVVVYYEVVGWEKEGVSIMAKGPNGYYDYGLPNGEFAIQVYRITIGGKDLPVEKMEDYSIKALGLYPVKRMTGIIDSQSLVVAEHPFHYLIKQIEQCFEESRNVNEFWYSDEYGPDFCRYKHVNEGIVLRLDPPEGAPEGTRPQFYKLKRPEFYAEEGLIKAAEIAEKDLEQE